MAPVNNRERCLKVKDALREAGYVEIGGARPDRFEYMSYGGLPYKNAGCSESLLAMGWGGL